MQVTMFDIVTLTRRHSESEHAEHCYGHFLEVHLLKGIHLPPLVPSRALDHAFDTFVCHQNLHLHSDPPKKKNLLSNSMKHI